MTNLDHINQEDSTMVVPVGSGCTPRGAKKKKSEIELLDKYVSSSQKKTTHSIILQEPHAVVCILQLSVMIRLWE